MRDTGYTYRAALEHARKIGGDGAAIEIAPFTARGELRWRVTIETGGRMEHPGCLLALLGARPRWVPPKTHEIILPRAEGER